MDGIVDATGVKPKPTEQVAGPLSEETQMKASRFNLITGFISACCLLLAAAAAAGAVSHVRVFALSTALMPQATSVNIVAADASDEQQAVFGAISSLLTAEGYQVLTDGAGQLTLTFRSSARSTADNPDAYFGILRPGEVAGAIHYRISISVSPQNHPVIWQGYADDYAPDADNIEKLTSLTDFLLSFWGQSTSPYFEKDVGSS
jgi:hypothetical protein